MKDAKFQAEKKRIRRMQDKWYPMMGLKWWRVTYEYVDDAAAMPKAAREALACAKADWRYMTATITVNLAETNTRDDDLVARGVDKDRLKSEINRLDEQIVRHVPPARMQRTSEKNVNAFEKAVQASMHAMAPEVTQLCEKRKDLNMRLEPDNPSAGSLKEIVGE